jgi:hypothetical protein
MMYGFYFLKFIVGQDLQDEQDIFSLPGWQRKESERTIHKRIRPSGQECRASKGPMILCVSHLFFFFMYKPFSVKAFGKALVFANFVVENFDRKSANSLSLISNM